MDGATIVDIVVIIVIFASALSGLINGFARSVWSSVGWIVGGVAALYLAPVAEPYIPFADSCQNALLFGGLAILVVIHTVLNPVVPRTQIGGISRGAGLLFGASFGVILVNLAFFTYELEPEANYVAMNDSRSVDIFTIFQSEHDETRPAEASGWLAPRYEERRSTFIAHCAASPRQP